MKEQKPMRFSDIKLGERTIEFEKQQLKIYTNLVKEHPENDYYKRTQLELAGQLKEDKKRLKTASKTSQKIKREFRTGKIAAKNP